MISNKPDLNNYLVNKMRAGHRHKEVTEWIMCAVCGPKYREAMREKERIKRSHPEYFMNPQADKNRRLDELITDITQVNSELRRIKNQT